MKIKNFIFPTLVFLFFQRSNAQKFNFEKATISSVGKDLRSGKITVEELTRLYLKRIDSLNPLVNAMLVINPEALALAKKADKELKQGKIEGKCMEFLLY